MTLKGLRRYLYMKYYVLETINNGKSAIINKQFHTRDQAINYAFAYFEHKYINENIELTDEFNIADNKHNIEYVLDYKNRFRVNRVVLA